MSFVKIRIQYGNFFRRKLNNSNEVGKLQVYSIKSYLIKNWSDLTVIRSTVDTVLNKGPNIRSH